MTGDTLDATRLAAATKRAATFVAAKGAPPGAVYDVGGELETRTAYDAYLTDKTAFDKAVVHKDVISQLVTGVWHNLTHKEPPQTLLSDEERKTIHTVERAYAQTSLLGVSAHERFVAAIHDVDRLPEQQKTRVVGQLIYDAANAAASNNNHKKLALIGSLVAEVPMAGTISFQTKAGNQNLKDMVENLAVYRGSSQPQRFGEALDSEIRRAKAAREERERGTVTENTTPGRQFTPTLPAVGTDIQRS